MKIRADKYDIPTEPGLYGVVWGSSDQFESILVTRYGVWVAGSEEPINLRKAPYNHPLTKFTERIELE